MHIGVYKITLRFSENHSLKGKRRIIRSMCTRVRNKFNVAIAEVESNDSWQVATLGVTDVSNAVPQLQKVLSGVLDFIERSRESVEIVECQQEIISGF